LFYNDLEQSDCAERKVKCKEIPGQASTDPEGFRRLRLPDFKIIGTWRWYGS